MSALLRYLGLGRPNNDSDNTSENVVRRPQKVFLARKQSEGRGAVVRRSIGSMSARKFTPFLMLDHLVSTGSGFPDHPHRGQETITYVLKGNVDHEDFTGSKGTIGSGDLQFMTAGKGIMHAEMPRPDDDGTRPEMMQLWVDLPNKLKVCEPRYRDLRAKEIPTVNPTEKVEIKVISGESYGVESVQDLAYTPVIFYDYRIQPGGSISQSVPSDFNVFLYLLNGNIVINGQNIKQHHCVLFKQQGNLIEVSVDENAETEARFILVGGKRLDQNVVHYGPFVETSVDKMDKAFHDFENAINGFERRKGWKSDILKSQQHH